MTEHHRTAGASAGVDAERARLDAELAGLARAGAQRRGDLATAAGAARDEEGQRHLRIAIGAYRGSTVRRVALALATAGGVAATGIAIVLASHAAIAVGGIAIAMVATVSALVPPFASASTLADEARWVEALPFRLEGYFDVLAGTPNTSRTLIYDIAWAGDEMPATGLIEDVVAAVDAGATVERTPTMGVRVTTSPISGMTDVNRTRTSFVTRNHRIPPSVHAMVDRVLVALHRRYPLARVALTAR